MTVAATVDAIGGPMCGTKLCPSELDYHLVHTGSEHMRVIAAHQPARPGLPRHGVTRRLGAAS